MNAVSYFEVSSEIEQKQNPVNNSHYKVSETLNKTDPFRKSNLFDEKIGFNPTSAGAVTSLAKYSTAGFVGMEVVDYFTKVALDIYDDKFKELGLGKYAKTDPVASPSIKEKDTTPISLTPTTLPKVEDTKPIKSSDFDPKDTLISVLRDGGLSSSAIAKQLESQNKIALANHSEIVNLHKTNIELQKLQSDVNTAYKEANLENINSINNSMKLLNETLSAIHSFTKSNQDVSIAYKEANLEKYDDLTSSINSIKDGIKITHSKNEIALTNKKLKHLTFETTPVQLDNLGETIPKATPQEMRAIKDAVVAKKHSDQNTFELDDEDIEDMFNPIPDISSIFKFSSKTERLNEVAKGQV